MVHGVESNGKSSEWYTPKWLLDALGETYDLDPCSPGAKHWVPATRIYTKLDDGLKQPWHGFVFMNPPFGRRNGHVLWLKKFIEHGNGIAIVQAYTSAGWFHDWAIRCDAMLFPRGKTKFVREDRTVAKAPVHGIVLLAMGERGMKALQKSGLGFYVRRIKQ